MAGPDPVGKAMPRSQRGLNRAVEVARAGIWRRRGGSAQRKRRFPGDGVGVRAAAPLLSDDLITYKAQLTGFFQPVIPAKAGIQGPMVEVDSRFRGNDGFRRARARVSIGPKAQAELCV